MSGSARGGFTLVEALIALTISTVLIMLVGSVFLVQNNFYSHVLVRSQVQENARAISEVIATETRSVASGAVLAAAEDSIVVRSPMATGFICGFSGGSDVHVHIPGGVATMDTADVAGYGYRDASTGAWTYYDHTWSELRTTTGGADLPAQRCATLNGSDTAGIASEFRRIREVENDTGIQNDDLSDAGDVALLFYRQTTFRFTNSALVPGDRALFRGVNGGTPVEFATGLASTAAFNYRRGGSTWYTSVAAANLSTIDAVRVVVQSQGKGYTSDQLTYDFGWTIDIPLANAF